MTSRKEEDVATDRLRATHAFSVGVLLPWPASRLRDHFDQLLAPGAATGGRGS